MDNIYRTYYKPSSQLSHSLKHLEKDYRDYNPDWTTWNFSTGIVDKYGHLQMLDFDYMKDVMRKEDRIREFVRNRIKENIIIDDKAINHYQSTAPELTKEQIQDIVAKEKAAETPIIKPLAYRMLTAEEEITYIICRLPDGTLGDFYCPEFKLFTSTNEEELIKIIQTNKMRSFDEEVSCSILDLSQFAKNLEKEIF